MPRGRDRRGPKRAVVLAYPALAAHVPACRVAADERFEDRDALAPATRFV